MTTTRREVIRFFSQILPVAATSKGYAGQSPATLTDFQKEEFLLKGSILKTEDIGHGVTKPVRAVLRFGTSEHYAKIQVVEKELSDFFGEDNRPVPMRDSWRFNIAAYRLDRLLRLNMVTVAVSRRYQGRPAAFSWWVDDVMFEEAERIRRSIEPPNKEDFTRQLELSRVFDELIINIDRNYSNLLITKFWRLALIDHSRSFNPYRGIRNRANLTRCNRALIDSMRDLTSASIMAATGKYLTSVEVASLLARRDRIVEHFEVAIREKGESNVIFP